nr:hypothetical protein [Salinispora arenicola]
MGLVTLVGIVSLSTGSASFAQMPDLARHQTSAPSAAGLGWAVGDDGAWGAAGNPGRRPDGKRAAGTRVPCDTTALVAAIKAANRQGGGTLRLAEKCVYTLTASQDDNGLPTVFQSITVHGQGSSIIRAAAAPNFRIFNVTTGGSLALWDVTVAGGRVEDANGGGILVGEGARLSLNRVTVRNNTVIGEGAVGEGGGIMSDRGKVTVNSSTITRNVAGTDGGGIRNERGLVEIFSSKVTDNVAGDVGGGYSNQDATTNIRHTLISQNHAMGSGGGVDSDADVTEITDSAIVHNTADVLGGGLFDLGGGTLLLRRVTVAHNTAGSDGGGLYLTSSIGAMIDKSKIIKNVTSGGDGGGIAIGQELGANPVVAVRDTIVVGNQAAGAASRAGGIFYDPAETEPNENELTLTNVRVSKNTSQVAPGGVYNNGTIRTFGTNTFVDNRPTNCVGSPLVVPTCFG